MVREGAVTLLGRFVLFSFPWVTGCGLAGSRTHGSWLRW